jgi:hypothetical protein
MFGGGGGGGGGDELPPQPAAKVPIASSAKGNRSARRSSRLGDAKTRRNANANPALAANSARLSPMLSSFAVEAVPGIKALMVRDAEVAPVTICVEGLTAQPKLAEDGKQARETVVLPPFGPPSSKGTETLDPDFISTRETPADIVKFVNVTVRGTVILLEGAKPRLPGYTAMT